MHIQPKQPGRRAARPIDFLLLLATCIGLAACAPQKAKITAVSNAASLQIFIDQALSDDKQAVHRLVQDVLTQQRRALSLQWRLEKTRLELSIHKQFDRQFDKAEQDIAARLNTALAPIEKRLNTDIKGQQGISGPEAKASADSLRLQLASTLAVFQNEANKLGTEAKKALDEGKDRVLKQLEEEFANLPDPIGKPVTAEDVNDILKEYDTNFDKIRADLRATTDSLREYVALDEPWKYVLKGVVGQDAARSIGERIQQLEAKGMALIQTKVGQASEKFASAAAESFKLPKP